MDVEILEDGVVLGYLRRDKFHLTSANADYDNISNFFVGLGRSKGGGMYKLQFRCGQILRTYGELTEILKEQDYKNNPIVIYDHMNGLPRQQEAPVQQQEVPVQQEALVQQEVPAHQEAPVLLPVPVKQEQIKPLVEEFDYYKKFHDKYLPTAVGAEISALEAKYPPTELKGKEYLTDLQKLLEGFRLFGLEDSEKRQNNRDQK